jgi:hypothetical protein
LSGNGSWVILAEFLPSLFFLNKKLHKRLRIVRSEDLAITFCYPDEKQVHYMYSMLRKQFQYAYNMEQVARLVRRPKPELQKLLRNKLIDRPSGFEYSLQTKQPRHWRWSQDEVLELRDRLYDLAPKQKDGFPESRFILASKSELLEAMNGDASYYVRNAEGDYIKVWRAI